MNPPPHSVGNTRNVSNMNHNNVRNTNNGNHHNGAMGMGNNATNTRTIPRGNNPPNHSSHPTTAPLGMPMRNNNAGNGGPTSLFGGVFEDNYSSEDEDLFD